MEEGRGKMKKCNDHTTSEEPWHQNCREVKALEFGVFPYDTNQHIDAHGYPNQAFAP